MTPLTHWGRDKMAAILQKTFSNSWHRPCMTIVVFWFKVHGNVFPRVALTNNPALLQVMACGWIDDKPLSEPMMASFTYMYCWTTRISISSLSQKVLGHQQAQYWLCTLGMFSFKVSLDLMISNNAVELQLHFWAFIFRPPFKLSSGGTDT